MPSQNSRLLADSGTLISGWESGRPFGRVCAGQRPWLNHPVLGRLRDTSRLADHNLKSNNASSKMKWKAEPREFSERACCDQSGANP